VREALAFKSLHNDQNQSRKDLPDGRWTAPATKGRRAECMQHPRWRLTASGSRSADIQPNS